MNEDLQLVSEYGNYLDAPPAEESKGAIEEFLDKPIASSDKNAVTVAPGEAMEKRIDKAKNQKSLLSTASHAKKKTGKVLGAAVPNIGDLPTPPSGGIGLLLFISLLIVFAITPLKSGGTRLSLLWGAVLGNQSLASQSPAPAGIPGVTQNFDPSIPLIQDPITVLQGVFQ